MFKSLDKKSTYYQSEITSIRSNKNSSCSLSQSVSSKSLLKCKSSPKPVKLHEDVANLNKQLLVENQKIRSIINLLANRS